MQGLQRSSLVPTERLPHCEGDIFLETSPFFGLLGLSRVHLNPCSWTQTAKNRLGAGGVDRGAGPDPPVPSEAQNSLLQDSGMQTSSEKQCGSRGGVSPEGPGYAPLNKPAFPLGSTADPRPTQQG